MNILFLIWLSIPFFQDPPSAYFEGKIVYESFTMHEDGNLSPSPYVTIQEIYFNESLYKRECIEGKLKYFGEIIVDTQDTTRFSVNHFEKIVKPLGPSQEDKAYLPLEITFKHANDTILGYPCKKYEIIQKDWYTGSIMKSYLWVAEDLQVMNLPLLGKIFGYRNSLIKDGSLGGIALKFESRTMDDSVNLIIIATEVVPMDLDRSHFAVPTVYFREQVR